MVELRALEEIPEGCPKLGEMTTFGKTRGRAELSGFFAARGLGRFRRKLRVPMYSFRELDAQDAQVLGFEKCEESCLGFAADAPKKEPIGYFSAVKGAFRYEVPVYDGKGFSAVGWRVCGYIGAGPGFVAVARRRTAFWIWLAVAALAVFAVSYFGFSLGWAELWGRLTRLLGF